MVNFTPNRSNTSQASKSWDLYWQGTGDVDAFTSGGVSHPAIRAFWDDFFHTSNLNYEKPEIIDIASGNGAVVESALAVFDKGLAITSLDVSASAIKNIHNRFPMVEGIVSDACSIPRESGSYDIVTSQFGVEYAGHDAVLEAARLVADGGRLALLLHSESGSIHRECLQSLEAIERIQAAQFIPFAIEMFDAGFRAVRGEERSAYETAANNLAPAINELEEIMKQYGQHVAGDTISSLYNDVGQIHNRIQHYNPEDVLNWLKRMNIELGAYAKRMSSMSQAAIDSSSFNQTKVKLTDRGFSIELAEELVVPEHELPMAWALIARR